MDPHAKSRSLASVGPDTGPCKMSIRTFFIALFAWEVCVLGSLVAVLAFSGKLRWNRDDLALFGYFALCGFLIVVAVAIVSRTLREHGVGIAGALCGVVPSVAIIGATWIAPIGVDVSASLTLALSLAFSSGMGGAIAGFICSYRTNSLPASDAIL
jgi:NAD/NADP transhydrogenase beta subunit